MALLVGFLKTVDAVSALAGRAVSVGVPLMVLSLSYEVISRYFFDAPTLWAQDTSIFLFCYIGLIGGAQAMRERAHINVDLIYGRLRPRGKAACDSFTGLFALFFLILVVVYGAQEAIRSFELGLRRPTDWAPPVGPFVLATVIGATLLALQTFANWLRSFHFLLTGRAIDQAPLAADPVSGEPLS